ncbi:glycosyltransferase [Colwellia psychrerythraea]|uniref:Glycosyl transferase, group 1 family protein n=1 Tax=Colwellia psychrerythraea (strain 34H / ATCC BAA-681) TaxID=167879 RepID=Q47U68_COLP3|nr:glycosyltransferase [Colwellia psychrerythraea]AAZ25604.1 glycosyl transferase, group 1 family protein [Colwellia psychrerythraea 34H]
MKSDTKNKSSLVIITNLFPLPWEPNRATFNRQQFAQLDDEFDKSVLVPIAFSEWFSHKKEIKQTENLRYVPYFYLPKVGRRFYSVFMFLSILMHSGWWLINKKPKIILASWAFPEAVAASWLSKLFNCHFFFKVHGSDINLHGKIPARAQQIVKAAKRASGILSVSKALADEMVGMGIERKKISVIYNGVDHQRFGVETKTPLSGDYLLYVGNLKHDKGVVELIKGFANICENYPTLHLVYAGSGVEKERLVELSKTLNIADKVQLLGSVEHHKLPALITHAKALVLPSYNEGVPNVILEAMACGTPVLATRVGGIPEVIDEKICGKLIKLRCEIAVENGLNYILNQPWNKKQIQAHSKKFTWENNKRQLIELLSVNN